MARRNRRADLGRSSPRPVGGAQRVESWRGVDYVVRAVTGQAAVKAYRCPGCDQLIRAGQPHLVAWAADDPDAEDRRHWHSACWAARENRGPGLHRGRTAPRY